MRQYTYNFPLLGMSSCSSDRIHMGNIQILAEVSQVHETGEFNVEIFVAEQRSFIVTPHFSEEAVRYHDNKLYVKPDFSESGLQDIGSSIMAFLDDKWKTFVADARCDGTLLVRDPEIDDYRPVSEQDSPAPVIDLRGLLLFRPREAA